ncbi:MULTISPECIES: HNH endonuclease [unclassified Duganella]|uniref:HNH endonuclease n=1 Tax=unclassified Duganella TaxID=2636909 RepID=UPI0009E6BE76
MTDGSTLEFIHVHHLKPLAEIKESYVVDPIQDLVPLCPNCHAMIHRSDPALSVETLRDEIKQANLKR